jgi:polysaccharide export outer membrane protein
VKVAGATVGEAEKTIAASLTKGGFFNDPQVSIFEKEYSTQGISVMGEVQKPGIYALLGPHTLFDAISAAGGTTPKAGRTATITHRGQPGKPESVTLNYTPDGQAQSNVPVNPGDTVVVTKAGIVYVIGDVQKPSGIVLENSNLSVLQAIAMAEGAKSTAALNRAKLIRRTPNGPQEIPLPLQNILSAKAPDVTLQPDDIVFVPNSAAKSATRRGLEAILQTATGLAIYRHP